MEGFGNVWRGFKQVFRGRRGVHSDFEVFRGVWWSLDAVLDGFGRVYRGSVVWRGLKQFRGVWKDLEGLG